jgi:hypothetical protein
MLWPLYHQGKISHFLLYGREGVSEINAAVEINVECVNEI